jgi:O-antigen ligase
LYFAVVALAPLPLGSAGAVAPAIWSVLLGLALLGLLPARLRTSQLVILAAAAIVAIVYLFVLHEQLSPYPWLPVAPHPLWRDMSNLLGIRTAPLISVAGNQPFFSAGVGIVSFLALAGGVLVGSNRQLSRQLLWVIAIAGAAYAVIALINFEIEPSRIFFVYEKMAHVSSLTTPFVNRNTAAIYYGCCALIWLMLGCERIERHLPNHGFNWQRLSRRLDRRARRVILLCAAGWFVCLLAMFLTGSRAGVGLSLLAGVGASAAFFHRRLQGSRRLVMMLGGAVLVALLLLEILGGGVGGRFSLQGLSDEGRMSTYRATWRMIADHPWLGTGLGTFEWLYPAYRTDDISLSGIWNRAHNSFLELAAGGGMLMSATLIIALIGASAVLAHGIRSRRRDIIFPVVALFATLAGIAHSNVDFSLQISGYAIVIAGLLGVGLAQSFRSLPDSARRDGETEALTGRAR